MLLFIVLLNLAHADTTEWRCTEEATTKSGNAWLMCSVGEAPSEGEAREKALKAGLNEFKTMCALDSDCKDRSHSVEPKRTTCQSYALKWPYEGYFMWKCYRLVQVGVE